LKQQLEWEKELLGTYMSDHPLNGLVARVRQSAEGRGICEISELAEREIGTQVRFIAMVEGVRRITTKANKTMAVAACEDLSGLVDLVLFPEAYERLGSLVQERAILDVRGKLDRRGDALQVICDLITPDLPDAPPEPVTLDTVVVRFARLSDEWSDIHAMQQADEILKRFEGSSPVVIELPVNGGNVQLLSRTRKVEWSDELERALASIGGVRAKHLVSAAETRLAS
jgi:DNA polymerase-3 subunit alpha